MKLVVDTNVALWACGSGSQLTRLRRHDLYAPWLMWSEFTSALHVALSRGQVTRGQTAGALDRLRRLSIKPWPHGKLQARTWELADEFGWSKTYDAEYLALADLLDAGLLTFDGRLHRAADHLGRAADIRL